MRVLGFVGKARMQLASEILPSAALQWYGQWCFAEAGKNCEVTCTVQEQAFSLPSALNWQKTEAAGGSIRLAGDWQSIVFGGFAREVPLDSTASHLLREAQLALLNAVLAALGQGRASTLTPEAVVPVGGPLNAQVLLQLSVAQASLYLLIDATLLNFALAPVAPRAQLVERREALGGARVKLSVRLPLASLSIGEMSDLHPGDTLRASALLLDPVSLQVGDGSVVASGYLARQQDHLAVQLISNE